MFYRAEDEKSWFTFSRQLIHLVCVFESLTAGLHICSIFPVSISANCLDNSETSWCLPPQSCFSTVKPNRWASSPTPAVSSSSRVSATVWSFGASNMQKASSSTQALIDAPFSMYRINSDILSLNALKSWSWKVQRPSLVTYGHLPPYCLDWQPFSLTQMVVRVELQNRGRQRGNDFLQAPFIIPIKLNVCGPYIHPSATQSSLPPVPGVPQFITPITQCSIDPYFRAPTSSYSSRQST